MKRYVIAVDEGTTSARAMLFDVNEKKFVTNTLTIKIKKKRTVRC